MISLEGIVTKCSLVRPKVVKSVHYNEKRKEGPSWHFREYKDQTMTSSSATTSSVYPREDDQGNPVRTILKLRKIVTNRFSSSPNTDTAFIEITKLFRSKKCRNVLLLVNSLVV